MTSYNETVTESVEGSDAESNIFIALEALLEAIEGSGEGTSVRGKVETLLENLEVIDTTSKDVLWFITEGIEVGEVATVSSTLNRVITENINLQAAIQLLFLIGITEALDVSDTTSTTKVNSVLLDELIQQTDLLITRLTASGDIISEGVTLTDALSKAFSGAVIEAIEVSAGLLSSLITQRLLEEGIEVSDGLVLSLLYEMSLSELAGIADLPSAIGVFSSLLEDYITLSFSLPDTAIEYYGWTFNPENSAVTNYDWNFSSLATYKNNSYLGNSVGLYLVGGNKDEADYITSTIKTAGLTFGARTEKQIPQVFLGISGTRHVITVSVDGGHTAYYEMKSRKQDALETKTLKIGKGLIGNTWQFTIIDKDQLDFDLDSLEFYPVFLKRKHRS